MTYGSMAFASLEEKPTEALRVASFDGGGIRGLSSLLLLRAIMYRIQMENQLDGMPLPCEYFHMICGTSTGGLIALMLGRLRMSIDEAIGAYNILSKKVFAHPKVRIGRGTGGIFKARSLEAAIKEIVKSKTGSADALLLDGGIASDESCRTFVCAMNEKNMNARIPQLFRTYESPEETAIENCTIWQAARATSAAPTFFKSMIIDGQSYIDGGMANNNPTMLLLDEARTIFPGRPVTCLLSFGTGKSDTISIPAGNFFQRRLLPTDVIKAIQKIATDCEHTHEAIVNRFNDQTNVYFRFNVEQGLQSVALDQWERLPDVGAHTLQYVKLADAKANLVQAAAVLTNATTARSAQLR